CRPPPAGNPRWRGGADRRCGRGGTLPRGGPVQTPRRPAAGDPRTRRDPLMREDELKQLKETRVQLVTELRSFSDSMQDRASDNGGRIVAEDQDEYEKREKDLIEINRRIE